MSNEMTLRITDESLHSIHGETDEQRHGDGKTSSSQNPVGRSLPYSTFPCYVVYIMLHQYRSMPSLNLIKLRPTYLCPDAIKDVYCIHVILHPVNNICTATFRGAVNAISLIVTARKQLEKADDIRLSNDLKTAVVGENKESNENRWPIPAADADRYWSCSTWGSSSYNVTSNDTKFRLQTFQTNSFARKFHWISRRVAEYVSLHPLTFSRRFFWCHIEVAAIFVRTAA